MGFGTGSFAKVWEIKKSDSGKYTDIQISISKKNQETDKYETTFSNFVRLIGTANKDVNKLSEGCRIKLGSTDVENRYDKEKKTTYYNFKVFSFEMADGSSDKSASPVDSNSCDGGDEPF